VPPMPMIKVNARSVGKSVVVPLSAEPVAIKIAPIPAAFLMPILSARSPEGMESIAVIITGMVKNRLVWVWVRFNSSLMMCSMGGIQNIGINTANVSRKALPSIARGMEELFSSCIPVSQVVN